MSILISQQHFIFTCNAPPLVFKKSANSGIGIELKVKVYKYKRIYHLTGRTWCLLFIIQYQKRIKSACYPSRWYSTRIPMKISHRKSRKAWSNVVRSESLTRQPSSSPPPPTLTSSTTSHLTAHRALNTATYSIQTYRAWLRKDGEGRVRFQAQRTAKYNGANDASGRRGINPLAGLALLFLSTDIGRIPVFFTSRQLPSGKGLG